MITNELSIPEYIEGIPTEKKRSKERVALIKRYYQCLWRILQIKGQGNWIVNDFLGTNIYIVERESDKKTVYAASNNWQSTCAVKYLEEVVSKATKIDDGPIYSRPKGKTQKANGYKDIVVLHHKVSVKHHPNLNFLAKLTIGVKANGKHIQYCVNKVERIK